MATLLAVASRSSIWSEIQSTVMTIKSILSTLAVQLKGGNFVKRNVHLGIETYFSSEKCPVYKDYSYQQTYTLLFLAKRDVYLKEVISIRKCTRGDEQAYVIEIFYAKACTYVFNARLNQKGFWQLHIRLCVKCHLQSFLRALSALPTVKTQLITINVFKILLAFQQRIRSTCQTKT